MINFYHGKTRTVGLRCYRDPRTSTWPPLQTQQMTHPGKEPGAAGEGHGDPLDTGFSAAEEIKFKRAGLAISKSINEI